MFTIIKYAIHLKPINKITVKEDKDMLPEEQAFYLAMISLIVGGSMYQTVKSLVELVKSIKEHRKIGRYKIIVKLVIFGIPFTAAIVIAIIAAIIAAKNGRPL